MNIDSIKLKSRSDTAEGFILWSELDFVLDPATTVLVVNIANWASNPPVPESIWDVEDELLLEAARLHLGELTPRAPLTSTGAES